MPFKKRERFDRSDVPVPGPLRNVVSLLVLALTGVCLWLLVTTLWHRVGQLDALGSRDLRAALRRIDAPSSPAEGYEASEHEFTKVLFVLGADDATLANAQLLVLDETDDTGILADLPLNMQVHDAGGSATMLSDLYLDTGMDVFMAAVAAATNVRPDHVIIAHADYWSLFDRLTGARIVVLLGPGADVLEGLSSDLSSDALLALIEEMAQTRSIDASSATGLAALRHIEAEGTTEQMADGRTVCAVDQTRLGVQLGLIVPDGTTSTGTG